MLDSRRRSPNVNTSGSADGADGAGAGASESTFEAFSGVGTSEVGSDVTFVASTLG